jgi:bacillopeptidase F
VNAQTAQPIAGAKMYLLEDAHIAPVVTDADGNFTLTALYGDYTLQFVANNYVAAALAVTLDGDVALGTITLKPIVGATGEIALDDGSREEGVGIGDCADCAVANKFVMPADTVTNVTGTNIFLSTPEGGLPAFDVEVWTMNANGQPGEQVGESVRYAGGTPLAWNYVDLQGENIQVQGTFFILLRTVEIPWFYGVDNNTDDRANHYSWAQWKGAWYPLSELSTFNGTFMIRAVALQEAGAPVLLTPVDGTYTAEADVTVTGTGTAGFGAEVFNGAIKAAETVTAADGTFQAALTLTEGTNVLTARLTSDIGWTASSAAVSVVLDTTAPQLTVTAPNVTTEAQANITGTVVDANLAEVTVDGAPVGVDADGTFTATVDLEKGMNTFTVAVVDRAGNTTAETVVIAYYGPGITIIDPAGMSGNSGTITTDDEYVTITGYAITAGGVPVDFLEATVYRTRVTLERADDGYFTYTFKKADLQGLPLLITLKDVNYTRYMFSLYVK